LAPTFTLLAVPAVFTETMILSLAPSIAIGATDMSEPTALPTVTEVTLTADAIGAGAGSAIGAGAGAGSGVMAVSSFFLQPVSAAAPTTASIKTLLSEVFFIDW